MSTGTRHPVRLPPCAAAWSIKLMAGVNDFMASLCDRELLYGAQIR